MYVTRVFDIALIIAQLRVLTAPSDSINHVSTSLKPYSSAGYNPHSRIHGFLVIERSGCPLSCGQKDR